MIDEWALQTQATDPNLALGPGDSSNAKAPNKIVHSFIALSSSVMVSTSTIAIPIGSVSQPIAPTITSISQSQLSSSLASQSLVASTSTPIASISPSSSAPSLVSSSFTVSPASTGTSMDPSSFTAILGGFSAATSTDPETASEPIATMTVDSIVTSTSTLPLTWPSQTPTPTPIPVAASTHQQWTHTSFFWVAIAFGVVAAVAIIAALGSFAYKLRRHRAKRKREAEDEISWLPEADGTTKLGQASRVSLFVDVMGSDDGMDGVSTQHRDIGQLPEANVYHLPASIIQGGTAEPFASTIILPRVFSRVTSGRPLSIVESPSFPGSSGTVRYSHPPSLSISRGTSISHASTYYGQRSVRNFPCTNHGPFMDYGTAIDSRQHHGAFYRNGLPDAWAPGPTPLHEAHVASVADTQSSVDSGSDCIAWRAGLGISRPPRAAIRGDHAPPQSISKPLTSHYESYATSELSSGLGSQTDHNPYFTIIAHDHEGQLYRAHMPNLSNTEPRLGRENGPPSIDIESESAQMVVPKPCLLGHEKRGTSPVETSTLNTQSKEDPQDMLKSPWSDINLDD